MNAPITQNLTREQIVSKLKATRDARAVVAMDIDTVVEAAKILYREVPAHPYYAEALTVLAGRLSRDKKHAAFGLQSFRLAAVHVCHGMDAQNEKPAADGFIKTVEGLSDPQQKIDILTAVLGERSIEAESLATGAGAALVRCAKGLPQGKRIAALTRAAKACVEAGFESGESLEMALAAEAMELSKTNPYEGARIYLGLALRTMPGTEREKYAAHDFLLSVERLKLSPYVLVLEEAVQCSSADRLLHRKAALKLERLSAAPDQPVQGAAARAADRPQP